MNNPVVALALGLLFGVLFAFRESKPWVKACAFLFTVVFIGALFFLSQQKPAEKNEEKWPLESCGGNEWFRASKSERLKACDEFASKRIAGAGTHFSADEYHDAITSYYSTGGDRNKSVRWVASVGHFRICLHKRQK
jgi:hypothetical protein